VQRIAATFGDDIDDSARNFSELSQVIVRLNFEFFDIVDNRRIVVVSKKSQVITSVQEKHVAPIPLSIYGRS